MGNKKIFAGERSLEQLRKLHPDDWERLILPGTSSHLYFYIHGGEMLSGGDEGGSARKIGKRTYWRDEQDTELCLRLKHQGDHALAPIEYYANNYDNASKVWSVARKFAEARALERITLIGHSFGGSVAANIFYRYSTDKRVRIKPQSLIMINAMLTGNGLGGIAKREEVAERMKGPVILVVGTSKENQYFVDQANSFKKKVPDGAIHEYSGGHSFNQNVGTVSRWILEEA